MLVASLSHLTKRFLCLSLDLGVVASRLVFVGSGGWVENLVRAGYGLWPKRRTSSKVSFLGVLDASCCKPASQPAVDFCESVSLIHACGWMHVFHWKLHAWLYVTQCIQCMCQLHWGRISQDLSDERRGRRGSPAQGMLPAVIVFIVVSICFNLYMFSVGRASCRKWATKRESEEGRKDYCEAFAR